MRLKSHLWHLSSWLLFFSSFSVSAQFFSRDTSAGSIISDAFYSSGASWTDINDDGWPDLYALGENTIRFYLNNQDGTFSELEDAPFLTSQGVANIGIWADYDNDGYLDLYQGNTTTQPGGSVAAANFLFHNEGPALYNMALVDIGNDLNASPSASWIDYDQDGDVDLFSVGAATSGGNGTIDLFYRNDRNSIFTRSTDLPFLKNRANIGTHETWIDYDGDADQDLFILNWAKPNELFKSLLSERGNPNLFEDVSGNGLLDDGSSFDISANWGDFDNDGYPDVFIAVSNNGADQLYHNNGNGTFTAVDSGPIVSEASSSSFGIWGDFDNDGDLDLFVAKVGQNPTEPALFRNEGAAKFVALDQTAAGDILGSIPAPQAGSWADYDNDGDLDLCVLAYANPNQSSGTPQPNYLFRNEQGNSNHWLNVKCIGQLSNRSSIGAKVVVKAMINGQSVQQTRYISGGASSFVFQSELRSHFGLGDATTIDSLIIEWPSGITQVLENVAVDQFLTVNEEIPAGFIRPNFYATQTSSPDTNDYTFQFHNVSQSDPNNPLTSLMWDFDDDGLTDSQEPDPQWTYTTEIRQRLPVKLTASNDLNTVALNREDYIEVGPRPATSANTATLFFTIPEGVSRVDTQFAVYNHGRGADSVFVSISDYGQADMNAVLLSPESFLLPAADTAYVTFTVLQPLLNMGSYFTRISIRSKYNSVVQEYEKAIIFTVNAVSGLKRSAEGLPKVFELYQNHPNPFNPSTSIRYDLPLRSNVELSIYNIQGKLVTTLLNNEQRAGRHRVQWNGKDQAGQSVSSGLYLYQVRTDRWSKTRKLLFLK